MRKSPQLFRLWALIWKNIFVRNNVEAVLETLRSVAGIDDRVGF